MTLRRDQKLSNRQKSMESDVHDITQGLNNFLREYKSTITHEQGTELHGLTLILKRLGVMIHQLGDEEAGIDEAAMRRALRGDKEVIE